MHRAKHIISPELMTSSSSSSGSDEAALEFMKNCYNTIIQEEVQDTARSRRKSIYRDHLGSHDRLVELYSGDIPRFNECIFKDRFRMSKNLFTNIVYDIQDKFPWFYLRHNARGRPSFSHLQKCTVVIHQLASGSVPKENDEFLEMSKRTSRECLHHFCDVILKLYREEFLRSPTSHDLALLYEAYLQRHDLPDMIGSVDCTHWEWRNCPTRYRGLYHRGDHPKPTIILETVASQDMWFWHAFFGVAGSNNDIKVLKQSTLFTNELHGIAPRCPFVVNGREYKRDYYLADCIYPPWSTFQKAFPHPYKIKEKRMKKVQEGAKKDVERAFRMLKSMCAIIDRKARPMDKDLMENVMYTCMILQNMILKDEGMTISPVHIRDPPVQSVVDNNVLLELRDTETHFKLRFDITEHIAANMEVVLTEAELNANVPT